MLTLEQKRLVPVAAFAAEGNIDGLRNALTEALDGKVAINAIKEVLVQTYAYAGFPRSLNALSALMDVVNKRHKAGKKDEQGKDALPFHTDKTMLEVGTGIQTKLVGQPVTGPLFEFAPAIDQFLKSHLFGDIFVRDNLGYETREVATIAMLAALQGAQSQLKSHYQMGTNTGLEKQDLREIVAILEAKVGPEVGKRASEVLDSFLNG
ncbi:carboxymuconolactone decarboxylase family protein [Bartonella apis]|uniref:Alkylhydroperoxidase/carboxymuconolactone decarboxylase n=1 Tax=Bartonella apis TaxID=1686310 RepID=A0A1R0F986_9HYPH|nr:carboxymuconolactone decarboxylase family protein [Bartonella apis]MCT6825072.1 carboxymuconolactone decarboxylase family protein [Bartonella apis]OLY43526.1 alkylhydroperoxidase/carboxymuconolactone decarboxylase [Bartonella apis]